MFCFGFDSSYHAQLSNENLPYINLESILLTVQMSLPINYLPYRLLFSKKHNVELLFVLQIALDGPESFIWTSTWRIRLGKFLWDFSTAVGSKSPGLSRFDIGLSKLSKLQGVFTRKPEQSELTNHFVYIYQIGLYILYSFPRIRRQTSVLPSVLSNPSNQVELPFFG